jgi:hypothetical protein
MGTMVSALGAQAVSTQQFNAFSYQRSLQLSISTPTETKNLSIQDEVLFGSSGSLNSQQSMDVLYQQAMQKLQNVVSDSKKALGIADDTTLDTSPEATAGRIADFALGAFSSWLKNHSGLSTEDAKGQFADFIGGAVQEGINQARGILTALNSLTDNVNSNIDKTWNIIQKRLADFVSGNDSQSA